MADNHTEVLHDPMPSTTRHPHEVVVTAEFIETLHSEILTFARCTRPSEETRLQVISGVDSVRSIVKMLWPEGDIEIYGSFGTGLCTCHSHVDLFVMNVPKPEDMSDDEASKWMLQRLACELEMQEWCHSIKPILPCTCMPVLMFLYGQMGDVSDSKSSSSTAAKLIPMDVTIGGLHSHTGWGQEHPGDGRAAEDSISREKLIQEHTGAASREYVLQKLQELPPLAPLVLILKTFLDHQGLSRVCHGGLGSFSLTLLVIFYLERVKAATSRIFPNGPDSKEPDSFASFNRFSPSSYVSSAAAALDKIITLIMEDEDAPYLGSLLLGFLRSFGFEINLTSRKVILKGLDGGKAWGFFDREDKNSTIAWIDNPLKPNVNVAQSSFNISKVQEAFRDMLHTLIKDGGGAEALKCDIENCEDLVAMRKLHHLGHL